MKRLRLLPAVAALAVGAALAPAQAAVAAPSAHSAVAAAPVQIGPNPTESSVTARQGPFATTRTSARGGWGADFNSGTIYYPTDRSLPKLGAIAVIPGFLSAESSISWYGPLLASHGFVVMTLTTNSGFDQPDQRSAQLLGALKYLVEDSSVRDRIDPTRLGVMGWSMGGGGTLRAAERGTNIKAAIPLSPWHTNQNWSSVRVPTMIIGAQGDVIAGNGSHSEPFYNNLRSAPEKAYMELRGGDHFTVTSWNSLIARQVVSWNKRFIDGDTRYDQFLCPPPSSRDILEFRNTCPNG